MRKIKKIVDLSWEFTAETPIYPGDPEPSVTVATTLENERLQSIYIGNGNTDRYSCRCAVSFFKQR